MAIDAQKVSIVVKPDDPLLIAIKAEFLHAAPDLTGHQINELALAAVVAMRRLAQGGAAR